MVCHPAAIGEEVNMSLWSQLQVFNTAGCPFSKLWSLWSQLDQNAEHALGRGYTLIDKSLTDQNAGGAF